MEKRPKLYKFLSKWLLRLLLGAAILAGGYFFLMSSWAREVVQVFRQAGEGDADPPQVITVFQRLGSVEDEQNVLALSPDGDVFATGGRDGLIRLWDGRSGEFISELMAHPHGVVDIAFSPDGLLLASTGRRGSQAAGNPSHSKRGTSGPAA